MAKTKTPNWICWGMRILKDSWAKVSTLSQLAKVQKAQKDDIMYFLQLRLRLRLLKQTNSMRVTVCLRLCWIVSLVLLVLDYGLFGLGSTLSCLHFWNRLDWVGMDLAFGTGFFFGRVEQVEEQNAVYDTLTPMICGVQWTAWLAHTRSDPPTLGELQRDVVRQQRLLHNVRILEEADQKQREQERELRIQQNAEAQAAALQAPGRDSIKVDADRKKATHAEPIAHNKLSQYHAVDVGATSSSEPSTNQTQATATFTSASGSTSSSPASPSHTHPREPQLHSQPESPSKSKGKPLPTFAGKDEYQPESWTPTAKARVKRGQ
ncbi:hypothetical protein D9758_003497 [Tetrapyrgos nigripes]|uniref:Uncharacterized protein n=1 Tax=Tetrapyrgos nigripes TaxID=182062 RepID=A0A8H5LW16_9AGAR|nr:hypothetical protein D9758_003497 [Tetrapyrgos nigripes]